MAIKGEDVLKGQRIRTMEGFALLEDEASALCWEKLAGRISIQNNEGPLMMKFVYRVGVSRVASPIESSWSKSTLQPFPRPCGLNKRLDFAVILIMNNKKY